MTTLAKTEDYLWVEAYRPKTLEDVILPEHVKNMFRSMIQQGEITNLLLASPSPGTGKTTTALALCNDLGITKPLLINASLNNSIDDIRSMVVNYATTVSLLGDSHIKVVILDEGERLSPQAQESLKGLMEAVHANCRFIITTNSKNRINAALISRCTEVDFTFSPEDRIKVAANMARRCSEILKERNIPFSANVLVAVAKRFSPDNRKILGELQKYSLAHGKIDEGLLGALSSTDAEVLIGAMKERKFNDVKGWVMNNYESLQDDFYGKLFKSVEPHLVAQAVPQFVLVINDYQRNHSIVPDRFIHFTAMAVELMMVDGAFKK